MFGIIIASVGTVATVTTGLYEPDGIWEWIGIWLIWQWVSVFLSVSPGVVRMIHARHGGRGWENAMTTAAWRFVFAIIAAAFLFGWAGLGYGGASAVLFCIWVTICGRLSGVPPNDASGRMNR